MLIKAENTAAIIVDVQEKLMPAMFNQEEVERNVNRLVAGLKLLEVPMIVTQQYTKGIGMTIPSVMETFGDDFSYMEKTSFGVYGEAPIKEAVDGLGKKNIIVCGTETPCMCTSDMYSVKRSRISADSRNRCRRFQTCRGSKIWY